MTHPIDLRCGDWRDVLADVGEVDAVVCDPPYSERTHAGQCTDGGRTDLVDGWAARCRGWFVCLSDSELWGAWRRSFEANGLTGFHPLPCVLSGMTVRLSGDGPSSWAVYANVARPKRLSKWGTLDGAYVGKPGAREHIGGKPLWLMRAIIRDYTRPGDLVCDPFAGSGTTLIAAAIEGRRAVGAELDPETYEKARRRIARGWTPDLFAG
jgi:site-specific DNA-methyltransferase (adenine-specific)